VASRLCTRNTYWLVEDLGKDEQENDVEEVNDGDRDVEAVCLLVHPWLQNADPDQEASLDDQQPDGLSDRSTLSKGHEDCLEKNIQEDGEDEVICSGTELDIEETPFVQ